MKAPKTQLRIATAQMNPTVGAIAANRAEIVRLWQEAKTAKADLLVTPEMSLVGYPAEDHLLNPDFLNVATEQLVQLAADTAQGPALLVGAPIRLDDGLYNGVFLLSSGKIKDIVYKQKLPNYGVFDEKRYFTAGTAQMPMMFKGVPLGVMVCEDTWFSDVAMGLKDKGAQLLISVNASPYEMGKEARRVAFVAQQRVRETGLPLIYVNQVGGQDELVFDGHSLAIDANGKQVWQERGFNSALSILDWQRDAAGTWQLQHSSSNQPYPSLSLMSQDMLMPPLQKWSDEDLQKIYSALVLGTRDYMRKTGFKTAVLGLSGGIDSAAVAMIAADAIGPANLTCLRLPSQYTADVSNTDADEIAKRLGSPIKEFAIEGSVQSVLDILRRDPEFAAKPEDATEENIQARLRGLLLMANSNKHGAMVLTTGNKSEVSVGYCTLYGDMAGGYNPLKDCYKMLVYALVDWRNRNVIEGGLAPRGELVPQNVLLRKPSAELRNNQTDQDSLPPYPVLDDILYCMIDHNMRLADIVARGQLPAVVAHTGGYSWAEVQHVSRLVRVAEYKRRQAAPGVKISPRSFGDRGDWRYPIASGFVPPRP